MSTTIGHALCGLTCLLVARSCTTGPAARVLSQSRWLFGFALAANLPDLDFLAGYLWRGSFHAFHGGISHSLIAAVAMGVALTALLARSGERLAVLPWLVLAVLLHVLVDTCAGAELGLHTSYGTQLLWPFSAERIRSPVTLFCGVEHETLARLLSWHNVKVIGIEIGTFALPLLLLMRHLRRFRTSNDFNSGICP